MTKPLIIYGIGQTSEVLSTLIERQGMTEIVAYCDDNAKPGQVFLGKHVMSISTLIDHYNPSKYSAFVAIGYRDCNRMRETYMQKLKDLGFTLYSFVDTVIDDTCYIGENVVVTANNFIQPLSRIEDGVFVWGGCTIGHHSQLNRCSWLSPGVHIGGNSTVGSRCFIGMGAIINQFITIGNNSILGTKTFVNKNLLDDSVVMEDASHKMDISAEKFWKIGAVR